MSKNRNIKNIQYNKSQNQIRFHYNLWVIMIYYEVPFSNKMIEWNNKLYSQNKKTKNKDFKL